MRSHDTSMGREDAAFPNTTWNLLATIADPADPQYARGMETLCTRYWRPVYSYLRHVRAKSNEDAKDLTQAFFLWLLEGETLSKYARERGSFRRYLKVVLGGFLSHQEEAQRRLKRGGGVRVLSLDVAMLSNDTLPSDATPDQAFDHAWTAELIQVAVDRTRRRLLSSGREQHFAIYERYEMTPADRRPTYLEIASEFGLNETDVGNRLYTVREMIRKEIREELGAITANPDELEDEWNTLFGT